MYGLTNNLSEATFFATIAEANKKNKRSLGSIGMIIHASSGTKDGYVLKRGAAYYKELAVA